MHVLCQRQIPHDVEERGGLAETVGYQFIQVVLALGEVRTFRIRLFPSGRSQPDYRGLLPPSSPVNLLAVSKTEETSIEWKGTMRLACPKVISACKKVLSIQLALQVG